MKQSCIKLILLNFANKHSLEIHINWWYNTYINLGGHKLKKFIVLLLAAILLIGLIACNSNPATSKEEEKESNIEESNIEELDLTGIPQNWIDLFTFDNVTILLKNTLTIKKGDEYKCVNGKWYCKYQGREVFENHSGRYIYDVYLTNYSLFSFDDELSCYKALGVNLDDSGFERDVYINMSDGKITDIKDTATSNSLTIISTLDFSNYGTTTIE